MNEIKQSLKASRKALIKLNNCESNEYYRNVHIPVENSSLPDIGFKKPCMIQKQLMHKVLKQTIIH